MNIHKDRTIQNSPGVAGVSDATIRNWNRLGVSEGERSAKLTARANKRHSQKSFKPAEYAVDSTQSVIIAQLLQYAGQHRLDHSTVLFFAASSLTRDCQNPFLVKEIQTWEDEITTPASPRHKEWFDRILPKRLHGDFLGLLYQSLLSEGKKAKSGSYYTPQSVARAMLEDHCSPGYTVLDPACGAGQFLLEAANLVGNPKCLYGIDNDAIAVRIADNLGRFKQKLPRSAGRIKNRTFRRAMIFEHRPCHGLRRIIGTAFCLVPFGKERLIKQTEKITVQPR